MKDGYTAEYNFCCRKNYFKNQDRKLNNIKTYNKQNTEKTIIYEKSQRKIDLNSKIAHNIGVKTRQAFKSENVENLKRTFDLIGCFIFF